MLATRHIIQTNEEIGSILNILLFHDLFEFYETVDHLHYYGMIVLMIFPI